MTILIHLKTRLLFIIVIGLFIGCKDEANLEEHQEIVYNIPADFELEILFQPKNNKKGSWVSLAEGPNGIFYACDQHGGLYQFQVPGIGETLDSTQIDSVELDIGQAQGLIWAFNSLFVSVNDRWEDEEGNVLTERGSGIYRLSDQNGDGKLDNIVTLLKLKGAGEHGPHSLVLGPDGKNIYFIAGNHTEIPELLKNNSRLPNHWAEDNLFPPFLDARGHANKIEAPGGWIGRFDPQGVNWELISAGFRNPYDMAFNEDGELFAFDADMEWDIGMPWYRPIRICHVTSGSEFGWRTGSGKWPVYYPDNLPAVVNLDQGSPTAVLSTAGLRLPDRFQKGLIAFDWSFGTAYFVNLQPAGSTYTGKAVEFFSGTPLPLTDAIAGSDGSLYFATGGRNLDSYFYRLRYTGDASTDPEQEKNLEQTALTKIRKQLETNHYPENSRSLPFIWDHLGHPDRFIRYAARIGLEHQSPNQWKSKIISETKVDRIILGVIALAKLDEKILKDQLYEKLLQIEWKSCSRSQQLDWLRALSLIAIRLGEPISTKKEEIINLLTGVFPTSDLELDRELSQLLVFLGDKNITQQCLELLIKHTDEKTITHPSLLSEEITSRSKQYGPTIMDVLNNMPPTEALFYGTLLSHAREGWTKELREKYFTWFYDGLSTRGGMSFKPFLENIRKKAMTNVPENLKEHLEELSGIYQPGEALASLPQPIGPGKDYNASEIGKILRKGLKNYKGNIEFGKRTYDAALCSTCHRIRGNGGNAGPDLTQLHTRFKQGEIITAIFSPNDEISDQYGFTLLHLNDGKKISGKVLSENGDKITIAPNPFTNTYTIELEKNDIINRTPSPLSPMPANLLNRLNEKEITDLFAFILSGGNKKHYFYGGKIGLKKK